jgi:hypothetical protein
MRSDCAVAGANQAPNAIVAAMIVDFIMIAFL